MPELTRTVSLASIEREGFAAHVVCVTRRRTAPTPNPHADPEARWAWDLGWRLSVFLLRAARGSEAASRDEQAQSFLRTAERKRGAA